MNAGEGGNFDLQLDAAELLSRQQGSQGWTHGMRRTAATALHSVGFSDDAAIGMGFRGAESLATGGMGQNSSTSAFTEELKKQTKLLESSVEAQKKANELAEKAQEARDEANEHHEKAADKAKGRPNRKAQD